MKSMDCLDMLIFEMWVGAYWVGFVFKESLILETGWYLALVVRSGGPDFKHGATFLLAVTPPMLSTS